MKNNKLKSILIKLKDAIMVFLVDKVTPIISIFYHPDKWPYTLEQLLLLPDKTLGKETALYLQQKHYHLIPKYESHDFKHVLLGYEMSGLGEVRLQFFAWGNGNKSPITFLSLLLGVIFYPFNFKMFMKDYKRGKQSECIAKWNFATLVEQPCWKLALKIYPIYNEV